MAESIFGEIIYAYTRADAIADGSIVDVSDLARELGFTYPVGITAAVDKLCTPGKNSLQDRTGRIWDLLWMLNMAIRIRSRQKLPTDRLGITVKLGRKNARLNAVCSAADPSGAPCITIMLPGEN
jgi:hypothetical protein